MSISPSQPGGPPESMTTGARSKPGCPVRMSWRHFAADRGLVELDVPMTDGAALAWLYSHGEIVSRRDDDVAAHLAVRLSPADLGRYRSRDLSR